MKRSEMLMIIKKAHFHITNEYMTDGNAMQILDAIESEGMLPPVQEPSIIDDGNGGQKHGPALRVWDKE